MLADLLGDFGRTVLDAQEELGVHIWVRPRSRIIFSKNGIEKNLGYFFVFFSPKQANGQLKKCKLAKKSGKSGKKSEILKKVHQNHEKNLKIKNSFEGSVEHPMGWVRADYEQKRSPDGVSKSDGVIFGICVYLY